jgi:hypothetical protein
MATSSSPARSARPRLRALRAFWYLAAVALGLAVFALTRGPSRTVAPRDQPALARQGATVSAARPAEGERALTAVSPPSLVAGAGQQGPVQDVPGAPGYDPVKFLGLISLARVYEAEPRNERWAAPVEGWIQQKLARDLVTIAPEVRPTVTCKTTACRWSWSGPPEVEEKVRWLQRTLFLGAITERTGRNEIVVAYHGGGGGFKAVPLGDAKATIEVLERQRAILLRSIQAGRRPYLDEYVPRNAWPKE